MEDNSQINIEELRRTDKLYKMKKDILIDFSKWMYENDYSIKTSKEYYRYTNLLLGEQKTISINKIKSYLNKPHNKNTVAFGSVRLFLKFLDDKYELNFPNFKYPRYVKETKDLEPPPTAEEVKLIIEGLRDEFLSNFRLHRYDLFTEVTFRLARRISEVIKLQIGNVDWNTWNRDRTKSGRISILKTKRKKSLIVPVPANLMQKLHDQIEAEGRFDTPKELLFDFRFKRYKFLTIRRWKEQGKKYDKTDDRTQKIIMNNYIKKVTNDYNRKIKIMANKILGKSVKSHSLRSAKATELDIKRVPVSVIKDVLGHSNIATTSRYIRNKYGRVQSELERTDDF